MKIKTKEQLTDFLNNEMAWRKKELTTIKTNVEKSNSKLESTAIRSAIVLLYAHWEGFLKVASEAYLEYVISKKLKYKDLALNFVALSMKQKLSTFELSNKATIHEQIIQTIYSCDNETATIVKEQAIKTKSNLNSIILKEMMATIGLDYSPYSTKANLIDEQLLNYRNNVAHGQFLSINSKEYINLHDEIRKMMENYKTDIENSALLELFER